jgi:hypothetical protein
MNQGSLCMQLADEGSWKLLLRRVKFIKSFFTIPMSDSDKTEFVTSITKINVVRAKITSMTFVIIEVIMFLIHYQSNRENLFNTPYIYYGSMYLVMLVVMLAFFIIFTKLEADVSKHISRIRYTGIFLSALY